MHNLRVILRFGAEYYTTDFEVSDKITLLKEDPVLNTCVESALKMSLNKDAPDKIFVEITLRIK